MNKSLVLTGMMGVGKTTIGRLLAKKLDLGFADIDKLIEQKEKITIKKIFEIKGEPYFRKIEKKVTFDKLDNSQKVIALGGGAFINSSIRKQVLKKALSFWLDISPDILNKRTSKTNLRPLINNKISNQNIFQIYNDRKYFYNLANHKINCNRLDKLEIVNKIIKTYENYKD